MKGTNFVLLVAYVAAFRTAEPLETEQVPRTSKLETEDPSKGRNHAAI